MLDYLIDLYYIIQGQKRQAFLTEINRLKQLITNLSLNKKTNSTSSSSSASSSSSDVVTARENTNYLDEYLSLGCSDSSESNSGILPADLTGLLIFSDIQLPIKESYINKLKSGEEKRLFYFLCLIRNGIQVLQTQVISVQELIPTKETYITFPNRMAINNVDINFKVKIDVYILVGVDRYDIFLISCLKHWLLRMINIQACMLILFLIFL